MRRDGEPPAPAYPHPDDPIIPALDHPAGAEPEFERGTSIPGRVELAPGGVRDADVMRPDLRSNDGLRPIADHLVLDHQFARRRPLGYLHGGARQLTHLSYPLCV
jgi:hypothetical protein